MGEQRLYTELLTLFLRAHSHQKWHKWLKQPVTIYLSYVHLREEATGDTSKVSSRNPVIWAKIWVEQIFYFMQMMKATSNQQNNTQEDQAKM